MRNLKAIFIGNTNEHFIEKYAVLLTFALCVFCASISFMEQSRIDPGNITFILGFSSIISAVLAIILYKKFNIRFIFTLFLFIVCFIFSVLWLKGLHKSDSRGVYIFLWVMAGFLLYLAIQIFFKKLTIEKLIVVIYCIGFMLRFLYCLYTNASARQHDVYNFGIDGHSGYIGYLYTMNFKLPNFDPTIIDQFYHPPLHHFLAALWWKILSLFGVENWFAQQSIQTLTLFYSSICMFLSYKIFKLFNLKGLSLVLAFTIIAFHPTFIIFAGSINNDILSVTFMLAAFYYAIKWFKTEKISDLIFTAITVGLGMLTKLSAYMICIPIATLFIIKFCKIFKGDKQNGYKNVKTYICNYSLFLIICAPIALFWSIRNLVLFDVSPAFVQSLSVDSWQYVGSQVNAVGQGGNSVLERLFNFKGMFIDVFDQWDGRGYGTYHEFNPMVSLIKTSVFGEYLNNYDYPMLIISGAPLLWSNVLLGIMGLVGSISVIFVAIKNKQNIILKVVLGVAYFSMLILYYYFCFSFPHHCTENIRYISPIIIFGTIFIFLGIDDLKNCINKISLNSCNVNSNNLQNEVKNNNLIMLKVLNTVIISIVIIFAISSTILFLTLGFYGG